MTLPLLLVTGATGYIGSHIVREALEHGYPVRITTRPAKLADVNEIYKGKVEVVGVDDVTTEDFTEALKGVGVVIHAAAPIPSPRTDPAILIDGALNGALNVLKQSNAAGIKKVIITSSFASVRTTEAKALLFTDHAEWNTVTMERVLEGNHDPNWLYAAAKTLAERAVWKFADDHPEVDITTVNPPFVYGPFAPDFYVKKGDYSSLSTAGVFHKFVLTGPGTKLAPRQTESPLSIDVRDVARAHILAITAPPTSEVGRKRLLIASTSFTWKDAVEHLKEVRPQFKERLSDSSQVKETTLSSLDTSRAHEILGLKEFISWEKIVEDTADALVFLENDWAI